MTRTQPVLRRRVQRLSAVRRNDSSGRLTTVVVRRRDAVFDVRMVASAVDSALRRRAGATAGRRTHLLTKFARGEADMHPREVGNGETGTAQTAVR